MESALEDYFTEIAACFTSTDTPAGCFMINTSATLAASSRDIARTVKSRHAMQEQTLIQFLRQRQERGEIPAHCNPQALAEYINCILQECRSRPRGSHLRTTDANYAYDSAHLA